MALNAAVGRVLLDRLTAAGLTVTPRDGTLLISPAAKLTDALLLEVVAAKPELLALLQGPGAVSPIEPVQPTIADKKARALQLQRQRRATRPRIDFYPSAEAMHAIDSHRHRYAGGDASSIINRALIEWASVRNSCSP